MFLLCVFWSLSHHLNPTVHDLAQRSYIILRINLAARSNRNQCSDVNGPCRHVRGLLRNLIDGVVVKSLRIHTSICIVVDLPAKQFLYFMNTLYCNSVKQFREGECTISAT